MANIDQQMLKSLQAIETYVKTSAGNSTKMIAEAETGDGDSAFSKANVGLIKAFKDLQEATKKTKKVYEEGSAEVAAMNVRNRHANAALKSLRDEVEKGIQSRKDARRIHLGVNKELEKLNDMGIDLRTSFALVGNQTKGEFLTAIDNAEDELNSLANAAAQSVIAARNAEAEKQRIWEASQKEFWKTFRTNMIAAISLAVTRGSQAAIDAQGTGFQFAGGVGAGQGFTGAFDTLFGMGEATVEAFAAGASIEEIQGFAAVNRAALTAALNAQTGTTNAMLTAQEGLASVEEYGDQLRDTFGFRGAAQLQAVGQSLTTLTNLGVRPTAENLSEFGQMIENVTKNSNATAGELLAEFQNLAEDTDFQALFLSMEGVTDVSGYLGETFLHLQKTVGLNIREFTAYQKFLAQQRQRTGSERVVQSAFLGQLAESMGLSGADTALLQQGAAFRESLGEEEGRRFDELFNQLGADVAQRRGQLAAAGDVQGLQLLDILRQGANLPEQIGVLGRDLSGVNEAQQAAQAERVAASESNTESLVQLNSTIREFLDGFAKSPLAGLSAGFFTGMTGAVFKGTLTGNLAAQKGGLAKLGKGAGVLGAGAVGFGIGTLIAENTGIDEWLGQTAFNLFGDDGSLSVKERRIRDMEDQLLERQVAMGQEAEELNRQRAEAEAAGNQAMIEKLDEQLAELRKQYQVMTETEEEKILTAKESSGGSRRGTRGR